MATKKINKEIPGLKILFTESWTLFKQSIGQLFVLNIISFLAIFIIFFGAGIFSFLRVLNWVNTTFNGNVGNRMDEVIPRAMMELPDVWILILVMVLFLVVAQTVIGVGTVLVMKNKEEEEGKSIFMIIKESLRYVVPMFLLGLVSFLLIMGGMFFFVVPGFIIAVLVSFGMFEVVIAKKGVKEAIIGSVRMITQNFSTLLARYVVFFIIYLAIVVIIPMLLRSGSNESNSGLQFLFSIINIFVGILGNIFVYVLYRRAKEITDETKPVSLRWIILPSVLGYIILALIVNVVLTEVPKIMNSPDATKLMKETLIEKSR